MIVTLSRDEIRTGAQALAAQGVEPSSRTLVRYFHGLGQKLSKKLALRHLQELTAAGETFTPVQRTCTALQPVGLTTTLEKAEYHTAGAAADCPASPPAPAADPVAAAEQALQDAELTLEVARENMDAAVLQVWLSRGIVLEGLRYGGYDAADPARDAVQEDARACMGDYRVCWQTREAARSTLEGAIKQYQRGQQVAWVARHRRELVKNLAHWEERLRRAPSDYAHAEAKKNVNLLRFAYEQQVAQAPVNGVTLENHLRQKDNAHAHAT